MKGWLAIGALVLSGACGEAVASEDRAVALEDLGGRSHAPLEVPADMRHVVVFTTIDCPIANAYAPELRAIARDHAPEVRLFLVHVDATLEVEDLRRHGEEYGYGDEVVLLRDPDHVLVERLGATITPEAFVLEADGSVAYRGRIDDHFGGVGKKRPAPTRRDLRLALEELARGEPVTVTATEPVGCFIE